MKKNIPVIALALMLGVVPMSGTALARGGGGHGGGGGGHAGGGFGGGHIGLGGGHIAGFGRGPGHSMGLGLHDRGVGRGHVAHDFRSHHFRGVYGWGPYNDCSLPYSYDYNNCYAYGG
jgi:hypothetical protein